MAELQPFLCYYMANSEGRNFFTFIASLYQDAFLGGAKE